MKNSDKITTEINTNPNKSENYVLASADAASDMRELFLDSLKDIYWAENALLKALPKMADNCTSGSLAAAIKEHILITQNQVVRLERVFELLNETAEGKKCEAITGIIKEGENILRETLQGPVRDAAIIGASQKIEHYEIASYGMLYAFATTLGENDAAKLLRQTLAEEKEADIILSDVAYNSINFKACTAER